VNETKVTELVAAAVGQKFDEWALQHPSLAAVIDRISLTDRTVQSLRDSAEYRDAVAAYHQDMNELAFLGQIADLAGPILHAILGL
jgi:hypothetical protein